MSKQQTIFEGFEVPVDKTTDKMLLGKLEKPLQTNVSRGVVEIYDEVERVFAEVKTLLPYIKEFELITTKERLKEYLQTIIENGVVALDTETDGLNPISDRIAGFSLYTYNENPAYVPINHDYFDSNVPLEIASAFINALLKYNIKVVMHNARFDIRVFWNALGVKLNCHFDTMIAAKLLNENEPENGLKALWTKYGSKEGGRSLRYNELFSGVKFTVFDPSRVVIYPALDGLMTLELYDFQSPYLDKDNPICKEKDLVDTASLFYDIEMPTIHTAVEMEQRGIALDVEYASRLEKEYTEKANTHKTHVQKRLIELMPQMKKNLSSYELSKLSNPINLDSPQQLQIVFYQGLQIEIPSKKVSSKEGSVDAEVIKYIAENYKEYADIAEGIIEYKGYIKNLNTYITALPAQINPKTNRLHTSWNTIGADTGRFSSREPNLQNIPSRNGDIRPMFIPSTGNVFIGCDYSAQEPKILADITQDPVLVDAFVNNKDVYSVLASMAYKLPYEQCTKDTVDGKKRRNHGKVLQLALSYGMRENSLALQLDISLDEATIIYNAFKENLRVAFEYGESAKRFCKANGYVKTLWGRKRRFPHYTLPPYDVRGDISPDKKKMISQTLRKTYFKNRQDTILRLESEHNVTIIDNTFKIRQSETQILNAIIQGT